MGQKLPRVQAQGAGRGAEGGLLVYAERLARGELLLRVELLCAVYAGGTFCKVHMSAPLPGAQARRTLSPFP